MASDAMFYSGDTKTIQVTITDKHSQAVNLTGASIRYTISDLRTGVAVVAKTEDDDITIGGDGSNIVTIALRPEDTADLEGVYRHELQITDSSGNVNTALQGYLTLLKDYA